jgi:hypothetical protein
VEPGSQIKNRSDHFRKDVMKTFVWACVLAFPLAAVAAPNASAGGFEINWNWGFDWHWTWGINCGHSCKDTCSYQSGDYGYPADGSSCGSSLGGNTGYTLDGFNSKGYGYAPMPAQAMPPQQVNYSYYGLQPVGYAGAPAYWYGR